MDKKTNLESESVIQSYLNENYNNIRSYMFWNGFMNSSDYDIYKFLFKELELSKYCSKKVCDYYQDRDRHAEYFRKYKNNDELCQYIADIISKGIGVN